MRLIKALSAVPDYLTHPSPQIPEELRDRSRILAALLLITAPALAFISSQPWPSASFPAALLITSLIIIFPAYLLNRAGRYRMAVWICIFCLVALPYTYLLGLETGNLEAASFAIVWLLAPLFLAYVMLNTRDVVLTLSLIAIAILAILLLNPQVTLTFLSLGLLFLSWSIILLLAASALRQRETQERRSQSQALSESETRYRTIFNAAMEGIIIHKNGQVITCNPAFAAILGYDEAEIPGMAALDFYAPDERERAISLMQSIEAYQVQGIRKDGTRFWAEVHGRPIIVDGHPVRVATVSDITQRKHAEQQQISLAVEQEKVKILQRFITSISHDLRTPLSTINTGLYLIERLKDDPDRFQTQIASVQAQVQHLDRLISDLLGMSRLDRRKTSEYRFVSLAVNTLVSDAVDQLTPQALAKRQTLCFTGSDSLPAVLVDEDEFRRMLHHLLQNAINFTPEDGEINVSTLCEGDDLVIRIRDTGIGIAAEDTTRIFDYFYRSDAARNPDTGGVGLGLTIARRICEAHNGRIEVKSAPGAGSVFSVHLPATQLAPGSANKPSP